MSTPTPITDALAALASDVRTAARAAGLTSEALATAVGVNPVTVRRFLQPTAPARLSPESLERLAAAAGLKVSVTYRVTNNPSGRKKSA